MSLALNGKRSHIFPSVFLAGLFIVLLAQSLRTRLYYDEILSYYVSQQPSASEVVQAVQDGSDNSAPLYFLIVHVLRHLLSNTELALRLPGVIGYCIACLCMYICLARRLPRAYAAAGMLLLCAACLPHSFEARPYGLLLGSTGCAIAIWQTAASSKRTWWMLPALTLSLMCAIAFHYFAIYLLIPFLAGEIARWRKSGRPDAPALLALAIPPLVVIPHLPIIMAARRFVPHFYSKIVFPISESRYLLNGRVGYFEAVAIVAFLLWLWKPWRLGKADRGPADSLAPHEWVFALALALAPYVAITVSLFTTRVFQDRYCIWALFGFVILSMAAVCWIARRAALPAVVVTVALAAVLGFRWSRDFVTPPHLFVAQGAYDELAKLPAGAAPIVFAAADVYMELSYYADPAIRHRLLYLASPELSRRYSDSDTDSFLLSALSRRAPVHVQDCAVFLAANPRFLLFDDPTDQIEGWLFWYLLDSGYRITPLQPGFAIGVYLVASPGKGS